MVNENVQKRIDRIFTFIVLYKCRHDGNFPTMQVIADGTGINSRATVMRYLRRMVEMRMLAYCDGMYAVPGGEWIYHDETTVHPA